MSLKGFSKALLLVPFALGGSQGVALATSVVAQNTEDELGQFEQDELETSESKAQAKAPVPTPAPESDQALENELDGGGGDKTAAQPEEKPADSLESELDGSSENATEQAAEKNIEKNVEPQPDVPSAESPEPPPPVVKDETPPAPVEPAPESPQPAPVTQNELPAASSDEPNEALEARLGRIFEKYGTQKMSDSEWEQIAGDKIKENYTIQPGDTLWDISVTLFGNGYFWPKVWQLNASITNPHDIKPGSTLSFTYGNESEAPKIQVTEQKPEAPAPEAAAPEVAQAQATPAGGALIADSGQAGDASEASDVPEHPIIPPSEKSRRPVLRNIPSSLPDVYGVPSQGLASGHVEGGGRLADYNSPMTLRTYLSETPPWSEGEVVDVESGGDTADLFQYIFIKFAQSASKGSYVVFRPREPLTPRGSNRVLGYPVEVLAEVQLVDRVEGSDNIYRALVTGLVNQLPKGASVLRGHLQRYNAVPTAQKSNVVSRIIGGEFENAIAGFMLNSIVFLDKGSSSGLKVGDTLPVFKNFTQRGLSEFLSTTRHIIGRVRVIKVTSRRATGVIVSLNDQVQVGDTTGAPSGKAAASLDIDGKPVDVELDDE